MDEFKQDRQESQGGAVNIDSEGNGNPSKEGAKKEKMRREDDFFVQAMPIVLLALGAFFGICVYTATPVGVVGEFFHYALFGVFGNAAFGLPPLLIYGAIFFKKDYASHTVLRKFMFSFFGLLLVAVMFYTFGVPEEQKSAFASFFAMGVDKIGGGIFGNYVGFALHFTVSTTGTIILSVLFIILFGMVFFGITPTKAFLALKDKLVSAAKARKEKRLRYAEEKERILLEKKNEAEKRAVSAFYGEALPVSDSSSALPQASRPAIAERENDPFLLPAGSGRRTFYDAEADKSVFEEDKPAPSEAPAYVSKKPFVAERDPFFSMDDDVTPASFFEEEKAPAVPPASYTAPVAPAASESARGEDGYTFSFVDEEDEFPPVEMVDSSDIPETDAMEDEATLEVEDVSIPAFDPSAFAREEEEEEEEEDFEPAPVIMPQRPVSPPPAEKPRVQIVDAHRIEHSGIESFAEEAGGGDKTAPAYTFPPLSLLHDEDKTDSQDSAEEIERRGDILLKTLASFNIGAKINQVSRGPRLTRYELVPDEGVRIKSIENLVNEIAMNLEALSVRIEAPIPGKAAVGVEVPNLKYSAVRLRGLLDTEAFRSAPGKTTVCLGVDVVGEPVFADLDKMPHLLVAGATGMGKSVCINSILVSLLYKARPNEVKLILIDPKKVEFKSYSHIPHLLVPIVTDAQKAAGALSWAVNEMERRYDIIEEAGVRNLKAYNKYLETHPEGERLPQIVIIIDELHDLMMQAPDAVEDSICRIAQKARAAGILLIIGTQRPSVNVITGVIKANIPSRIAFHVAAQVDSRTILDCVGAEKLLNDGDMLFLCPGMRMLKPKRVQGAFLDDDEVNRVADFLRTNSDSVEYSEEIMAEMERESEKCNKDKRGAMDVPAGDVGDSEDDLFYRAVEVALENGKISTSLLQRKLSLGFGKAARMIDRMQEMGIVSEPNGQKPRDVLISYDDYRRMRLREDE